MSLTRLTTRMSADEMTFDPRFSELPEDTVGFGHLSLQNETLRLPSCTADILELERYQDILARQACASVYCGSGECVVTTDGPGCVCDAGSVARAFTDLDGQESITCVPEQAPVDYSAGGITVPDACVGVSCGIGSDCVDVGGFPTCRCVASTAAASNSAIGARAPICRSIIEMTASPGAQDFSSEVAQVRVCAPTPPSTCGATGWLVRRENVGIRGENCQSSLPNEALLTPPEPTCEDFGLISPPKSGCGCRTHGSLSGGSIGLALLVGALLMRRRITPP